MAWTKERIAKTHLAHFNGFGSRRLRCLFEYFDEPSAACSASSIELERIGIPREVAQKFIEWRKTTDVDKELARLEQEGIRVVLPDDEEYPMLLRESSDRPEILFVRGTIPVEPAIAIVGTRHISSYGKQCVETIVPELVQTGMSIISGLAIGIDGYAHELTLEHKGKTFAFLGTGVDNEHIYPRYNYHLAQRILTQGGGIASEFPPGTEGFKGHFPIRNRLIASFCLATVVIEATEDSGSLITAKLALEENREVMAVPGPIWSDTSKGSHRLLKAGAKVCTSAKDILDALSIDQPELISQARSLLPLSDQEQKMIHLLNEPCHIDRIGRDLDLKPHQVASSLSLLEMKGFVQSIGGQMWLRTATSRPSKKKS